MADDPSEEFGVPQGDRRRSPQPVNNEVLAYQIGTFKESLDRGLATLERTIEKGLDAVAQEVKELNGRVSSIERRQEYDAARLKELEKFRAEQDRLEAERARQIEADLRASEESSQTVNTLRWLLPSIGGMFGIAGVVAAIVSAT